MSKKIESRHCSICGREFLSPNKNRKTCMFHLHGANRDITDPKVVELAVQDTERKRKQEIEKMLHRKNDERRVKELVERFFLENYEEEELIMYLRLKENEAKAKAEMYLELRKVFQLRGEQVFKYHFLKWCKEKNINIPERLNDLIKYYVRSTVSDKNKYV